MFKNSIPKQLFPFIWYFLKQHPFCLLTFFIVGVLAALEVSLAPYLLKVIIDTVNKETNHPELLLSAILLPAVAYGLLPLLHNLIFRCWNYAYLTLFPQLRTEVITKMFEYLSLQSHNYFQQNFSGSLANKISDMPQGIESLMEVTNQNAIPKTIAVLIACSLLYTINPIFSLILAVWAFVFVANGYRLAKKSRQYTIAFSETSSAVNGQIVDSVSNIASAKIFANEEHESQRIKKYLNDLGLKDRTVKWFFMKINFVQGLLYFILIASMLSAVIYGRIHGWITLGDFAFVLTLAVAISSDVYAISEAMPRFSNEMGKCQQALSVIIAPIDIQDEKNARPINISKGVINFKKVNFSYLEDKPIFKDLTLSIFSGQKIGLVGFSGGGKSTLINLILRLYDIQSGEISIDGQDIKKVTLDSLRRQIAYIPQDPGLFHRSILDNIRYGKMDATEHEVIEAAKKAHCHEFIEQMPEGYHSLIGERGVKLSGGQKQRVAIARAMLKQAPILILDEATSALDSVTEKYIQNSLHEIMENRTVIAIAHRLSTLSEMNRILFMQKGEILEDGSIQALRKQNGYFAKLWNMQQQGFLPIKFSEIFLNPSRFFRSPTEVVESLEFSDKDKIQILRTWKFDVCLNTLPEEEKLSDLNDAEISKEIDRALVRLGAE